MHPSIRELFVSVFALFVVGPACSGVVKNDVHTDAGKPSGGDRDGAVSGHVDAGSGGRDGRDASLVTPDARPSRTCDELTASAQRLYGAADPDLSCTTDADCVDGPRPPCVPGCGFWVVSNEGAKTLQSVVDQTREACDAFSKQMCPVPILPCVAVLGQPACLEGKCARFIPQQWPSMTLVASNVAYQLECTTSDHCTSYTVNPSGEVFSNGPAGGKQFDAAAVATIQAMADDVAFRKGLIDGFGCAAATSTTFVTLSREFPNGAKVSQDVTGCIFAGPKGNQPRALWDLFQSLIAGQDAGAPIRDAGTSD